MSYKNGIALETKTSKKLRNEIDRWKNQQKARKCTDFSDMSYWEIKTTNTAL
ncbi:hypothetical protein [Aquimarina spongiae]|uniref:Uncharacterized protein n=1 Tax=Aquimarina spongiae TaxID=570521 RepID=A0A1M6B102_9FLAO|nr:hypothetical protein [Aquimarina spongiae]SHI42434.1 hypothetical protein SAMN04488508_101576 [Aquimarina spongiae]